MRSSCTRSWVGFACVLMSVGIIVAAGCGESSELAYGGPPCSGCYVTHGGADAGIVLNPDDYQAGEEYGKFIENDFIETNENELSTFSIDVDTASYTIMRRDLDNDTLPVKQGVRVEEYINFFEYSYPLPEDGAFSIELEMAPSEFGDGHQLLRIGIKGLEVEPDARKDANLVFLVDVSGSMQAQNKLPLVKYALKQLLEHLQPTDRLGIVVYASDEGVLLESTPVSNKSAILDAIESLTAGGSTNGEGGIRTAYGMAEEAKRVGGINRVILCTDGDFNVGLTGDPLISLIEEYREKGVTLTGLGFGMGNYKDDFMEQLADKGNGNYAYIDGPQEAERVLGTKIMGTLQVIAKDVKLQLEFDSEVVQRYRLVGYENRLLAAEDFEDDTKDAGEIGSGHTVTAFYELKLADDPPADAKVATMRVRYKQPDGSTSTETSRQLALAESRTTFEQASADFRFAAAVAEYAEILRHSKHSQGVRFEDVLGIVRHTAGDNAERLEFIELIERAQSLWLKD